MADDPLGDRRRAHEEDYFQKKDRELIEKMRLKARQEQERKALGAQLGTSDPDVLDGLAELGFTPETASLLPLIPVLEMAWAEGSITPAERRMVTALARTRGVAEDSAADRQLTQWLDRRPAADVFRRATRLINALVASGGNARVDADDLLMYCEQIAEASGGIFGIGRVSAEERATLSRIAEEIRRRQE
ncbi:MAG TPA: hypothetical protein VD833_05215 [Vicinamibacterales bacterium]|nr:hypothetical protein [Vicinamibacterales bacterium]